MIDFINSIKPLFPVTFNLEKFIKLNFKDNAELFTMLVKVAIYLVFGVVVGIVLGILGAFLGFLGLVWAVIGAIVEIYNLAGIILSILDFAKVFEPKE